MATPAERARDRRALNALVANAQGALARLLSDVPTADQVVGMTDEQVVALYKAIRDRWWLVADQYGTMAAALGQAQASMMLQAAGWGVPKTLPTPVGIPDEAATGAILIDALAQDDWLGALTRSLDGAIKTANTWSICDVIEDNGAELIWHPIGTTCRYCLQRASHGAYAHFKTEAQARGFATRPHDGCDCRPEVIPPDGTYPDDYHPTEYSRRVEQMDREKADRAYDRRLDGWKTPGPKTRQNVRRDASAKAWADRQRITRERDAAKNRLARAAGDQDAMAEAQQVLDRTAAERAALNGTN